VVGHGADEPARDGVGLGHGVTLSGDVRVDKPMPLI
jgi:hypothetical protein